MCMSRTSACTHFDMERVWFLFLCKTLLKARQPSFISFAEGARFIIKSSLEIRECWLGIRKSSRLGWQGVSAWEAADGW